MERAFQTAAHSKVLWLGSVACRMETVREAQSGWGVGLCRKAVTCSDFFFVFVFLGKTCFPACWHPVESRSAATWGVKDLEAALSEVLKPKQTLFMKHWHTCVC